MNVSKETAPYTAQEEPAMAGDEIISRLFRGDEQVTEMIRSAIPEEADISSWHDVAEFLRFEDDKSKQAFPGMADRFDLNKILNR